MCWFEFAVLGGWVCIDGNEENSELTPRVYRVRRLTRTRLIVEVVQYRLFMLMKRTRVGLRLWGKLLRWGLVESKRDIRARRELPIIGSFSCAEYYR